MPLRTIGEPRAWNHAAGQVFTLTGSSQQTAAFQTRVLRLATGSQPAWYRTASNPTAAADGLSIYLPPNMVELVALEPGHKLAALQAGTGGTLHVMPASS